MGAACVKAVADLPWPYGNGNAQCSHAVPVRVGEQSHRIKEIRLRFYHCSTMFQPPAKVVVYLPACSISDSNAAHASAALQEADMHLAKVVERVATSCADDPIPDLPLTGKSLAP